MKLNFDPNYFDGLNQTLLSLIITQAWFGHFKVSSYTYSFYVNQ